MTTLKDLKRELDRDPEFEKAYEDIQPELAVMRAIADARAEKNLTQKQVSEALDRLRCTRIVIAHRLSTIRNCDRILLIEDGKIAEEGTYEELIEKGGSFARLVERQRLDT